MIGGFGDTIATEPSLELLAIMNVLALIKANLMSPVIYLHISFQTLNLDFRHLAILEPRMYRFFLEGSRVNDEWTDVRSEEKAKTVIKQERVDEKSWEKKEGLSLQRRARSE